MKVIHSVTEAGNNRHPGMFQIEEREGAHFVVIARTRGGNAVPSVVSLSKADLVGFNEALTARFSAPVKKEKNKD